MTRDDMHRFFERRLVSWQRRDVAALTADYADEALVESPSSAAQQGREAIRAVYEHWLTAFPDLTFEQEELLIDGPKAAVVARVSGTHRGPFFGAPPTGRRLECAAVFVYTVRDHRIVRERRVLDFTGVLLQLGVLKAKPA
ncbi:MAG TPA: ester cyclase [Vicinamibacterales bacterium]|nr:ester cyclase [Vicinamibacterales bacterium]